MMTESRNAREIGRQVLDIECRAVSELSERLDEAAAVARIGAVSGSVHGPDPTRFRRNNSRAGAGKLARSRHVGVLDAQSPEHSRPPSLEPEPRVQER